MALQRMAAAHRMADTKPTGPVCQTIHFMVVQVCPGQSFPLPYPGWQVTKAEVRVDTRGRCWTVLPEPGSLSYCSSSRLESGASSSWTLSDFVSWKLLEVPGLGGGQKDMLMVVRTFQKCVWVPLGCTLRPHGELAGRNPV